MNLQEFESLKQRSKEAWIKMERWRLAYRADHKSISNKANVLKWATVFSGVLTGASALSFLGDNPTEIITGVGGFTTGVLSIIDKVFQWERNSNEAWRNAKLLEDLQSELYQYVWSVGANKLLEDPESFLTKINNKTNIYTSHQCSDPDTYLETANDACSRLNFESMQFIEQQPIDNFDDDILPDDVGGLEDIQAIVIGG